MGRASRVRKLTRTAVLLVAKLGTESTSTCPASARQHRSLEQALTHCWHSCHRFSGASLAHGAT